MLFIIRGLPTPQTTFHINRGQEFDKGGVPFDKRGIYSPIPGHHVMKRRDGTVHQMELIGWISPHLGTRYLKDIERT